MFKKHQNLLSIMVWGCLIIAPAGVVASPDIDSITLDVLEHRNDTPAGLKGDIQLPEIRDRRSARGEGVESSGRGKRGKAEDSRDHDDHKQGSDDRKDDTDDIKEEAEDHKEDADGHKEDAEDEKHEAEDEKEGSEDRTDDHKEDPKDI